MFLLDSTGKSTEVPEYCFLSLFQGCNTLTEAPALPATTLAGAEDCYYAMFEGCKSLTTAPELKADTLTNYCYNCMFDGCTSLKVNENGTEGTKIFTCPTLTGLNSSVTNMFRNTISTFGGTPSEGQTYH